jgi:hypothetical protein
LCEAALRRGCTRSQFIAEAIERMIPVPERSKSGRLVLKRPLLAGKRKPIAMTNEQIYKLGFPW